MNFLKFLKQYPLILAFVVSIAVANIWQVVQNAKKIDNSATTASQTTTSATDHAGCRSAGCHHYNCSHAGISDGRRFLL